MPLITEAAVDDARAHDALASYFAERAATFPAAQGTYRTAWPESARFIPPAGVFLLLVSEADAPEALACGGIRRLRPADADCYEVKHLWVRPASRGQGLGRLVLGELEARAAAFGASEVVLDTNASLSAAGGLYRSQGYADIPPYNDNTNATVWLRKDL